MIMCKGNDFPSYIGTPEYVSRTFILRGQVVGHQKRFQDPTNIYDGELCNNVKGFQPLTIVPMQSILDVCRCPDDASGHGANGQT